MNKALNIALGTLIAVGISAPLAAAENWLDQFAVKAAVTYTKPSNNQLDYGVTGTANYAPLAAPYYYDFGTGRPLFIEPKHEADFFGGITFKTSKDGDTRIFFDYDHYNDSKSGSATNIDNYAWLTQDTLLNMWSVPFLPTDVGYASAKFEDHNAKLGLSQTLHFGQHFDFVVGGFFEYAKLEKTQNFARTTAQGAGIFSTTTRDELKGFGPGVRALGRGYPFGNDNRNWSLFFGGDFSMLWSDSEYHFDFSSNPITVPAPVFITAGMHPEETHAVVSRFETSLGVEYNRLFSSDVANVEFGVRLGLKYINYLNAFKNGNYASYAEAWGAATSPGVGFAPAAAVGGPLFPVPANNRVYPLFQGHTPGSADYGRMGPFLEFRLGGAHS